MKSKLTKSRFRIITLTLLLILGLFTSVYSLPSNTKEFYVADYANVLSQDTKDFIIGVNLQYEQQEEQPQIVVLTTLNTEGEDIQRYATKVFEKWKIGSSKYDNGLLILLDLGERRIEVEVGYGLEGALNDAKVGRILDDNLMHLSRENYDYALRNIFYEIAEEVNSEYNYKNIFQGYDNINISTQDSVTSTRENIIQLIIIIIILMLITSGGGPGLFLGHGGFRGPRGPGGFGGGGFGSGGFGGGSGGFGGGGKSGGGGAGRGF